MKGQRLYLESPKRRRLTDGQAPDQSWGVIGDLEGKNDEHKRV
jgi:hypothetical protein